MDKYLIFEKIVNALLPPSCVGCGTDTDNRSKNDRWLCPSCRQKIALHPSDICSLCRRQTSDNKFCLSCVKKSRLSRLIIAFERGEIINAMIKAHKYSFIQEISDTIFQMSEERFYSSFNELLSSDTGKIVVLTVPLHPWRLRWRGFNQSEVLAKKIAEKFGLKYNESAVRRQAYTLPQSLITNPQKRLENMENAFVMNVASKKDVIGKTVILVDDVFTTGSTMNECAKILKKSGAKEIWGAAIMRG